MKMPKTYYVMKCRDRGCAFEVRVRQPFWRGQGGKKHPWAPKRALRLMNRLVRHECMASQQGQEADDDE